MTWTQVYLEIFPDARVGSILIQPQQLIFALQLPVLCRWQQLLHKC